MGLRRRLLGTSSKIYAGRLGGAALVFLAQAGIARFWGAEILGEYLLVIATVNIVSVLLPLGFETIGTYFAAEYRARGEGRMLRSFMRRSYWHIGVTALAVYLGGLALLGNFGEPGRILLAFWLPTCLMAVANALIMCNGALMVGLKHPYAGFFGDAVFRPVLILATLVVTALMLAPGPGFAVLIWVVGFGYLLIALVHALYSVRVLRSEVAIETTIRGNETRRWWRFAVPWVLIVLGTDFFFDLDLLILAGFLDKEQLAVFGVCTRIFALVAFGVTAVYGVTLPDIFESEAKADRAGFMHKLGDANAFAATFALIMFAGIVVAAPLALMLFGPSFQAGHLPLAILSLALLIRAVFGPAAMVLSINDRPYATLPAVALGAAVLIAANLALVPSFELNGAAWAALLAQSTWAIAMWLTALRLARIDVSILPRLREMLHVRSGQAAAPKNG